MNEAPSDLLERLRPKAFAIAYHMLGVVADAEDVAQEALLRVHGALAAGAALASPEAYVATVATRLSIDALRSARARREAYVGEWIPEPIVEGVAGDASRPVERAESVSLAALVLLERLSPPQRAALLLRDVFGYGYAEVAAVLDTSAANARQLVSRARRRVREWPPRFEASAAQRDALARRFLAAVEEGDVGTLEALLADDVVLRGDGGGRVPALSRELRGRTAVARTLLAWTPRGARAAGAVLRPAVVNGGPGARVLDAAGALLGVIALDVAGDRVRGIYSVVNPDKLRRTGRVGDFRAFLSGHGDA